MFAVIIFLVIQWSLLHVKAFSWMVWKNFKNFFSLTRWRDMRSDSLHFLQCQKKLKYFNKKNYFTEFIAFLVSLFPLGLFHWYLVRQWVLSDVQLLKLKVPKHKIDLQENLHIFRLPQHFQKKNSGQCQLKKFFSQ